MTLLVKNLAQFKNALQVGMQVRIENKLKNTSETRPVLKVQSNGIYTGREVTREDMEEDIKTFPFTHGQYHEIEGKIYREVWMEFQKASQMSFKNNTAYFHAFLAPKNYDWLEDVVSPSNQFEVGEIWLKVEIL